MEVEKQVAVETGTPEPLASPDFDFLPKILLAQCRNLIESYHEVHGFACLPDILWKSRLGPFIERHRELRQFLRKASTTRSAKKSHEGFARIATTILSLEILSSSFAGWGAIYPEAAELARDILKRNSSNSQQLPLMEFYLYPPKYISSAAIATLAPPADCRPELAGEKRALNYVNAIRETLGGKQAPASPVH
ncbi:hypothetical protein [Bradyrhizobium sp. Tv2a-2]|uniref:hypothetical protein n=1 Tax=Bradyrhizobium sp. Tv2a-2 TaxID=113395 RepID=UPI00040D8E4C|nr:hypothetical protein [Bradyrhizobium sp. Tv2a-2]